ncbi:MAG: GrdX family protein [Christensenellales bacterium]|jgi:hypothetical protein
MLVVSNNPLVQSHLMRLQKHAVAYAPVSFRELLILVRDKVHQGHVLLTHPLSGSVKPNETLYKSIGITQRPQASLCVDSLLLIEEAIMAHDRFSPREREITPQMDADFQLVDWTLLQSALLSDFAHMHGTPEGE